MEHITPQRSNGLDIQVQGFRTNQNLCHQIQKTTGIAKTDTISHHVRLNH